MCVQEPGSITLEPCTRFVDDWVTVSEPEIAAAMLGIRDHHGGMLLEGMCAGPCQHVTQATHRSISGKRRTTVNHKTLRLAIRLAQGQQPWQLHAPSSMGKRSRD
jgi:threonine dehydratase